MRPDKLLPTAKLSRLFPVAIALGAITLSSAVRSQAQTETVIYSFPGYTVGNTRYAGLIFDTAGNLYSTAYLGGAKRYGSVFELTPSAGGWQGSLLHAFKDQSDGANPTSNLIFDAAGNLYGTTATAGTLTPASPKTQGGCGVVYKLSPISGGGWREPVLHAFNGPDGAVPVAALISDSAGNLYGTTGGGGNLKNCSNGSGISGCGVVFELSLRSDGTWQETVLHAFTGGADGAGPVASLVFDAAGNLYGTTSRGGNLSASQCVPNGCGVVFKLSPQSGGGWHETVLHTFTGTPDGAVPGGSLIFDASGNLYGTAAIGGPNGNGAVFEITP